MPTKESPRNHKSIYILLLFSVFFVIGSYIYGYSSGYDQGELSSKNEFLAKKVNLVGSYFDEDDNLQLNTFSCTPNDEDGDCSKKIIENYVSISNHWLNYCKQVSNAAFSRTIQKAEELRKNIEASTIPFGFPTARCNDGTLSYSGTRSGTCSNHEGVSSWY